MERIMDNDNREESGLSTSDGISGVQNNNQNIRADWHHYEENVNNQDGSNQTSRLRTLWMSIIKRENMVQGFTEKDFLQE